MAEQGKVKWFSNVKGYGFLQKEGLSQDIFVHYSTIVSSGYKRLNSGEEVTFEIVQGEKGPQAKDVVRAKKEVKTGQESAAKTSPAAAQPSEKPAAKAPEQAKKADAAPSKEPQESGKGEKK